MTGYFDATEAFVSLGFVAVVLCWGLTLAVLIKVPGLAGKIYEAYGSYRQEGLDLYISRFIPYRIYHALVLSVGALTLSVIALRLAVDYGYLPETLEMKHYLLFVSAGLVAQGVMWLWRALSFALWSYVFMDSDDADLLTQDYVLLQLVELVVLLPLLFMALSDISTEGKLWSVVGLVGILQLWRIVQVCRRLWHRAEDSIYIFLYLCTHEIAPLIYTIALVGWGLGRLQGAS